MSAVLWSAILQFLNHCVEGGEDICIACRASRVAKFKSIPAANEKVKIVPVAGVEWCEEFSAFGGVIRCISIHGPGV